MRRLRSVVLVGALLAASTACGSRGELLPRTAPVAELSSTTSASAVSPATTTTPAVARVPTQWWLAPAADPPGLRLVAASHTETCAIEGCFDTGYVAGLDYDSDDPTTRRSLQIVQRAGLEAPLGSGVPRQVGSRRVVVTESGDPPFALVEAAWLEPDLGTVTLRAVGLGWHTVAAVIAGMRRVDPSVMPVLLLPPPPVLRCVDAGTQLAPAFVPPGWKRYVLEAHPTGSCGQYPFVMLSVAAPRSVIARASSSRDRGNRASAVG